MVRETDSASGSRCVRQTHYGVWGSKSDLSHAGPEGGDGEPDPSLQVAVRGLETFILPATLW